MEKETYSGIINVINKFKYYKIDEYYVVYLLQNVLGLIG